MKTIPDNQIYTIKEHSFKKFLENAIYYYEKIEMYEKCSKCICILNRIKDKNQIF